MHKLFGRPNVKISFLFIKILIILNILFVFAMFGVAGFGGFEILIQWKEVGQIPSP
jgi:hypothetical protein